MQYRTFRRTGWQVSEIAFCGWQIGGDWGTVDDDDLERQLSAPWAGPERLEVPR